MYTCGAAHATATATALPLQSVMGTFKANLKLRFFLFIVPILTIVYVLTLFVYIIDFGLKCLHSCQPVMQNLIL